MSTNNSLANLYVAHFRVKTVIDFLILRQGVNDEQRIKI